MFTAVTDIGITGKKGSGKTLLAVILGRYISSKTKLPLITAPGNFHIKGETRNINDFTTLKNLRDSVVVFDEMFNTVDSRNWANNIEFSKFWLLSRHYDLFIIYTTQRFHQIDIRVRDNTSLRIYANQIKYNEFEYTFIDTWENKILKTVKLTNADRYFDLYNTRAILDDFVK